MTPFINDFLALSLMKKEIEPLLDKFQESWHREGDLSTGDKVLKRINGMVRVKRSNQLIIGNSENTET